MQSPVLALDLVIHRALERRRTFTLEHVAHIEGEFKKYESLEIACLNHVRRSIEDPGGVPAQHSQALLTYWLYDYRLRHPRNNEALPANSSSLEKQEPTRADL